MTTARRSQRERGKPRSVWMGRDCPGRVAWFAAFSLVAVLILPDSGNAQTFLGQGTWTSNDGQLTGTWQATFDAAGQDLSGDIKLTGLPDLFEGGVDGTWSPTAIDFGVMYRDTEAAVFDGAITGTSVKGTFTTTVAVAGQWQGQLVPIDPAATATATAAETPTPPDVALSPTPDASADATAAPDAVPTPDAGG
jgi:hypothetical protein